MNTVYDLTDEELEECFDGSTSVELVREILEKPLVIDEETGSIDLEEFSQWFAYGIEGYIDADEDTDEWQEAWDNNQEWGRAIAENINNCLQSLDEDD